MQNYDTWTQVYKDVYKDILNAVGKSFNISKYVIERQLPKRKNKKSDCANETWIGQNDYDRV